MTQLSSVATREGSQHLVLSWPLVAFFGGIHAVALLSLFCFSWSALAVALVLHWLMGSIGICLGYHRLLTHKSFQVPKWLEYIVATIGALAIQGGPIFWVARHRQHHAFTEDVDKDPYSAKRGFWWSHMLWMVYPKSATDSKKISSRFAADLSRDRYYLWLDRNFLLLQLPLAAILYVLGGWPFVIYGIFLRSVLLWHSTWLINSATHVWGNRVHDVSDNSGNLWWAALLTYGEGWHNNHHAFPRVAPAGWKWWQIDSTWWVIRGLQSVGLAQKVVMPPQ